MGVPVKLALYSAPMAFPSPGATWTLQATRRPEALLHRHHVGQIGMFLQRMHDRQFSGPRIAEEMRDTLVLEQREECRASGDAVHGSSLVPAGVTVGLGA